MATDALPLEPADFRRWQRTSYSAGAAGMLLCAVAWLIQPAAFLRLYLWAFTFVLGIALGCLVLVLLQFLTGGIWGLILRRLLEAATRTIPVLALFFLPIVLSFLAPSSGIREVYIWADPAYFNSEHASGLFNFKAWYLSPARFVVSAVFYFAVWVTITFLLNRWSPATDRRNADDPRQLRKLSAAGLMLYGLTITLASIDWVMSLEPSWMSSIFGALFGIGQVLSALAFAVIALVLVSERPPLAGVIGRAHLRDLGSLLLAFVMVWAYFAFSQYLLIWSGNLPNEIPYYLRRFQGGWQWLALALPLFHFALPFVLLLSSDVKRDGRRLLTVAALVLVMRGVDLYWMIVPAQPGIHGQGVADFWPGWAGVIAFVGAPIGIGGVWLAVFLGQLQRRRLLPEYDPLLAEAMHHE